MEVEQSNRISCENVAISLHSEITSPQTLRPAFSHAGTLNMRFIHACENFLQFLVHNL